MKQTIFNVLLGAIFLLLVFLVLRPYLWPAPVAPVALDEKATAQLAVIAQRNDVLTKRLDSVALREKMHLHRADSLSARLDSLSADEVHIPVRVASLSEQQLDDEWARCFGK